MKFLILLLFQIQVLANTVQISAPQYSNEEFNAYYESHKELGPTFVDHYTTNNPTIEHIKNINSLYEKAMRYYFAKTRSQAVNFFNQIVELSLSEDWRENQRQMIFNSYLRLAELTPLKSKDYLEKAVAFDSTQKLNSQFNKKIQDEFEVIKSVQQKKSYTMPLGDYKKFNKMLLNGRNINLEFSEINILPGQYRVTVISNKYKPFTFIFSAQQLLLLTPPTISFAENNCEDIDLDYYKNIEAKVYNPLCKKDLNLLPVANNSQFTDLQEVNNKPIYEKTWFWIAAGALTSFLIIKSTQKQAGPTSETIQP